MLTAFFAACGSGDEVTFVFVSDFSVDPGSTAVGDQASVLVVFESSKGSIFNAGGAEDTDLVVLLPDELRFVAQSSELDGSTSTGFVPRSPSSIDSCDSGSNALIYNFNAAELSDVRENRLRFKVLPTEASGSVVLVAETGKQISSPCRVGGQATAILTITID